MARHTKDKIVVLGKERLPEGGALIVPNYLSFHDLLMLEAELEGRRVSYLIEDGAIFDPLLQAHLEKDGVTAFEFVSDPVHQETFQKQVGENVGAGEYVIFVQGQSATRTGALTGVPSETLSYLTGAGVPVVPLFVARPQGERLSIEPASKFESLVFVFGRSLEGADSNLAAYQEALYQAGTEAFEQRSCLQWSLGYALLLGLKKHGAETRVITGDDGKEERFDKLLALAIVLSQYVRQQTTKNRVGIVLPPSFGGLLANVAVLFAGKTPVNLNFTASEAAIESAMKQADIDRLITVDPFVRRMQRFPWPANRNLIYLERVLPRMKAKIAVWMVLSRMLPAGVLAGILGLSKRGGDREAVLLFTSGSSGDPKGVVLTHRNLMANVNQFSTRLQLRSDDAALGCLPLFHSFGCTVTMWYPVIEGVNLVTHPSPLEIGKLASFIEKYRVSLLVTTPTFLRGYIKKVKPEQLQSLKYVVTGAEKLPRKVAEAFEERFGHPVLEGYGLTETSPVTNVNLPDSEPEDPRFPVLPCYRPGSVGQFIPGMAVRITDPETDEAQPLHETGMIWLKGPNVFQGYLHQPEKTSEMLEDGWLKTGDIGRVDEDGFLFIDGRLSRFSKIGGEMVPHETLEDSINSVLGLDAESERKIVVVGLPDEAKGETLTMLSAIPGVEATDLRYRLLDKGVPSLWIPRTIIQVHEIPHLASGKLNLKECQRIAQDGGEEVL